MTHDDCSLLISIEEDTISSLSSLLGDQEEVIRDLKDEVNWLHAELHGAELEAEKLRGMLGCPLLDVGKRARQNGKRLPCERLMERNTELRELVRDWYALAVGGANSLTDWNHEQADLEQRMEELGIEV